MQWGSSGMEETSSYGLPVAMPGCMPSLIFCHVHMGLCRASASSAQPVGAVEEAAAGESQDSAPPAGLG